MGELDKERWEKFAMLTATGHKRADAFFGAGYQAKNRQTATKRGVALFAKLEIKARVVEIEAELRGNAIAKAEIDREWVLRGLKTNIERAAQAKPVRDRHGKDTGQFKYEPAAVNRGYELVGKELGMFTERFQVEGLDSVIEGMSTEEIRAHIRAACTEVGLRVVDMDDDQLRDFIVRNAERVGLRVSLIAPH